MSSSAIAWSGVNALNGGESLNRSLFSISATVWSNTPAARSSSTISANAVRYASRSK